MSGSSNFNKATNDLDEIFAPRNWFKTTGSELCGMGEWQAGEMGIGISQTGSTRSLVQEFCSATNWASVSQGRIHTAGLKEDGTLWTWGYNLFGALGVGNTNCAGYVNSPVPEYWNATNWCHLMVGAFEGGGVKADGSLWMWGRNEYGALGINSSTGTDDGCVCPVREVTTGENWLTGCIGFSSVNAIKTDGTMWGWGYNMNGEIATNQQPTCSHSSPVREASSSTNWCQVSKSEWSNAGVKKDGTLWAWGRNCCGAANSPISITNVSSPVQEVSSSTNWCKVTVGNSTLHGLKEDNTLWGWGYNECGMVGDGCLCIPAVGVSSPVQEYSSSTDWVDIMTGASNGAAIKANGTMWMSGANDVGQLGKDTTTLAHLSFGSYGASNNWKSVDLTRYGVSCKRLYGIFSNDCLDFTIPT